ncbi:nitroreductase/quinone reductase family protein [Gordonia sp. CPCC 205515]|uniref:nitroreductase/quinone reductase family protein n=1 Tax=Gordonia sp. CPCC 205515 TaxID=3140791 RepID=UPI003AF3C009
MSFTTANGTRGSRQPGGLLLRVGNSVVMTLLRKGKSGKIFGESPGLVLTTVGRKSGEERTNPVSWFPGENGSRLIVASANGAAKNPAWYYNIASNPDKVRIEVDGRKVAVRAEQLNGEERAKAWRQIADSSERFAKYQEQTDRELPVIRLTERES